MKNNLGLNLLKILYAIITVQILGEFESLNFMNRMFKNIHISHIKHIKVIQHLVSVHGITKTLLRTNYK